MLIHLDVAITVGEDGRNEQSDARNMTGTLEFIAIEDLQGGFDLKAAGIEHTYRHDLESFFCVFLWICIRYGWEAGETPECDPLSRRYTGSHKDIYSVF